MDKIFNYVAAATFGFAGVSAKALSLAPIEQPAQTDPRSIILSPPPPMVLSPVSVHAKADAGFNLTNENPTPEGGLPTYKVEFNSGVLMRFSGSDLPQLQMAINEGRQIGITLTFESIPAPVFADFSRLELHTTTEPFSEPTVTGVSYHFGGDSKVNNIVWQVIAEGKLFGTSPELSTRAQNAINSGADLNIYAISFSIDNQVKFTGDTKEFNPGSITIGSVPEPSSAGILAAGAVGLAAYNRRRNAATIAAEGSGDKTADGNRGRS